VAIDTIAFEKRYRDLKAKISICRPSFDDYIALGTVCSALGYFEEAKEYYKKALQIHPENLLIQTKLAELEKITSRKRGKSFIKSTEGFSEFNDLIEPELDEEEAVEDDTQPYERIEKKNSTEDILFEKILKEHKDYSEKKLIPFDLRSEKEQESFKESSDSSKPGFQKIHEKPEDEMQMLNGIKAIEVDEPFVQEKTGPELERQINSVETEKNESIIEEAREKYIQLPDFTVEQSIGEGLVFPLRKNGIVILAGAGIFSGIAYSLIKLDTIPFLPLVMMICFIGLLLHYQYMVIDSAARGLSDFPPVEKNLAGAAVNMLKTASMYLFCFLPLFLLVCFSSGGESVKNQTEESYSQTVINDEDDDRTSPSEIIARAQEELKNSKDFIKADPEEKNQMIMEKVREMKDRSVGRRNHMKQEQDDNIGGNSLVFDIFLVMFFVSGLLYVPMGLIFMTVSGTSLGLFLFPIGIRNILYLKKDYLKVFFAIFVISMISAILFTCAEFVASAVFRSVFINIIIFSVVFSLIVYDFLASGFIIGRFYYKHEKELDWFG
jgi:tetratricopeptide (TPR) repeat protein